MNRENLKTVTSKISITAYRAIKLLEMLLISPCSSTDILNAFLEILQLKIL